MTYVVVASCMAFQLSGTIHLAVVQHAICAEHGEAMEVGDAPTRARPPAADSRESRVHPGANGSPASESHHHCPLDEDRSTHALLVRNALVGPRLASPAPLPAPHTELTCLAPRTLRLLAPKTSPPA
jgi:hypothetical protein